jgi:superfamily II RNA helicase
VLLILRGCALSSNANGAFPSALASGFERVKKILSEIESEGEPARERLRIRFARQMASDAMEQRLREQEEERHRQELVEAERNELRKRDRERQEERSALLVECEQLKSQIEELEEKEANRLREEEKKRKLRAKKKSKSTTRG